MGEKYACAEAGHPRQCCRQVQPLGELINIGKQAADHGMALLVLIFIRFVHRVFGLGCSLAGVTGRGGRHQDRSNCQQEYEGEQRDPQCQPTGKEEVVGSGITEEPVARSGK